jgi:hypothetical protein
MHFWLRIRKLELMGMSALLVSDILQKDNAMVFLALTLSYKLHTPNHICMSIRDRTYSTPKICMLFLSLTTRNKQMSAIYCSLSSANDLITNGLPVSPHRIPDTQD